MKNQLKIISLIGGIGFFASSIANAVEPGQMYFKIDGGYSIGSKPKYNYSKGSGTSISGALGAIPSAATEDKSDAIKTLKGYTFSAGVGYNMTSMIRGDLALTYSELKNKSSIATKATNTSPAIYKNDFYFDNQYARAMLNVYFDLNNRSDLTPFVGFGAGAELQKYKIKYLGIGGQIFAPANSDDDGATANFTTAANSFVRYLNFKSPTDSGLKATDIKQSDSEYKGKNKIGFAYQASLGFSYKMTEGMFFEMAYKFENVNKYDKMKESPSGGFIKQNVTGKSGAATTDGSAKYDAYNNFALSKFNKSSIVAGFRIEF